MSNTLISSPVKYSVSRTNKTLNFVSVDELLSNAKCKTNRDFLHWYLRKNTNYDHNNTNKDTKISPKFIGVPHNVTFDTYKGNVSPITTRINPLKARLPLPMEEIIDSDGNYKKPDHLISNFDKRRISRSPRKYKQS
ncbi:unnamed protein product, partial [marine sediment metagenome]